MFRQHKRKADMGSTPKDSEEKVRRGYRNPDTIVFADGREWLRGYDWIKRVKELRARSGGRCEFIITDGPPRRCTMSAVDPHHQVKRSVLRDDRIKNLLHVCRFHHRMLDERKIRSDKKEKRDGVV